MEWRTRAALLDANARFSTRSAGSTSLSSSSYASHLPVPSYSIIIGRRTAADHYQWFGFGAQNESGCRMVSLIRLPFLRDPGDRILSSMEPCLENNSRNHSFGRFRGCRIYVIRANSPGSRCGCSFPTSPSSGSARATDTRRSSCSHFFLRSSDPVSSIHVHCRSQQGVCHRRVGVRQ